MIGGLILLGYVIGLFLWPVPIARALIKDPTTASSPPDRSDKAIVVTLSMVLAVFWPLIIPGYFVWTRAFPADEKVER